MAEITDRVPDAAARPGIETDLPPARDDFDTYRPLSFFALGGFGLAALSAVLICLGGWMAIFFRHWIVFSVLVLLTPAVAAVICLMVGVTKPAKIASIAGFALAALMAVLGLGGLLLYSNTDPWLLPTWALVFPAGGLMLLWIGRSQILRSENTLSGLPLTNWGLGVVAVFGLLYAAYYGATWLAMTNQSGAFADEWLNVVARGDLDIAFVRTLPADQRPREDNNLRMQVETVINQPGPNSAGMFSTFAGKEYVRLLEGGGSNAKIERLGLIERNYDANGDIVARLSYHVSTPVCACELQVAVRGRENRSDQSQGRQWYIDLSQTGLAVGSPPAWTDLGDLAIKKSGTARDAVDDWLNKCYHDDDEAYLLTLPAAQRRQVQLLRPVLGTAVGGLALWTEPGRQSYYDGGLIDADAKRFYAIKQENAKAVPAALKKAFRPGEDKPSKAELMNANALPFIVPIPDGVQLAFDLRFTLDDKQKDALNVDARVFLECDAASLGSKQPQWQVKKIQLIRARSANAMADMIGGPRGMMRAPQNPALP
jgi:hypothetical protein